MCGFANISVCLCAWTSSWISEIILNHSFTLHTGAGSFSQMHSFPIWLILLTNISWVSPGVVRLYCLEVAVYCGLADLSKLGNTKDSLPSEASCSLSALIWRRSLCPDARLISRMTLDLVPHTFSLMLYVELIFQAFWKVCASTNAAIR